MNITSKKIIAKEIIYFFSVITLLLIFWSIIEIRNFYSEKKIKTISYKIENIQLQIDKNEKKTDFLLKPEKEEILINGMIELLKNGSAKEETKAYVNDFYNKFSEEKIELNKKTKTLQNKKNILSSDLKSLQKYFLNNNEKKYTLLLFSVILFSILYPIRLVFKLIKWSLLIMRYKEQ
jgi:hypothetical protein